MTAFKVPEAIGWERLNRELRARGVGVGGNYGALAGKVFRLGHMGTQAHVSLVNEAHTEAEFILHADPANGQALLTLASSARTPEEISTAKEFIEKFPARGSGAYYAASAPLLLKAGDASGAEAAVRKAVAADPKFIPAHSALARLCAAKNGWTTGEPA